ncbi:hypothetical protein BY996DRAFT_8520799 [Phakopsora pachyrhizi]|nr:hypothetical protein BY996DRAFT_8520799 [Phakopsora pachyrhizi]
MSCEKATDGCNGHGDCLEEQKTSRGKCFVCSCKKSKDHMVLRASLSSHQTHAPQHLNKTSGGELDRGRPPTNGINRNGLKSKVENWPVSASRVTEDVKMKLQQSSCSFAPVSNDLSTLCKAISVPLPPDDKPFPSDHEVNHATAKIKLPASHVRPFLEVPQQRSLPSGANSKQSNSTLSIISCKKYINLVTELNRQSGLLVKIKGIKPPNQSSITDKSKSNKEQDDLVRLREDETIEIGQEIHTGPDLKMPPGKGRRARWKAGKEQHSKATERHESAIQAQGKYEKE